MSHLVDLTEVSKVHGTGAHELALDAVSVHIGAGEFTAIMGPSGSGKSTLLNLTVLGVSDPLQAIGVRGDATRLGYQAQTGRWFLRPHEVVLGGAAFKETHARLGGTLKCAAAQGRAGWPCRRSAEVPMAGSEPWSAASLRGRFAAPTSGSTRRPDPSSLPGILQLVVLIRPCYHRCKGGLTAFAKERYSA